MTAYDVQVIRGSFRTEEGRQKKACDVIKILFVLFVHAYVPFLTLYVVLISCFAGLCCVVSPLSQVEASHRAKREEAWHDEGSLVCTSPVGAAASWAGSVSETNQV